MIKIKELKRITDYYVYYGNKTFYLTYTYYSLVYEEGELYWRQWNKKLNRWIKLLNVLEDDNYYKVLNKYLLKQYLPFKY